MGEPFSFLSNYQLISLILSNVFPYELCISIVGFLKLSEFELSRKEYLLDYRGYRKERDRYINGGLWRGTFHNSLSNIPRNIIRYRPTCEFLKVRGSIYWTIRLHKDFSLKPYYNTFGKKYEKVTRKIKVMARGYQKYRRVNETLVNYMIRVAKKRNEPTPYVDYGNNYVVFNFFNNIIMNTFQNTLQDTEPLQEIYMKKDNSKIVRNVNYYKNTKKRVKKDFRLNKNQNKKYQNKNFKRSRVNYKNSCR